MLAINTALLSFKFYIYKDHSEVKKHKSFFYFYLLGYIIYRPLILSECNAVAAAALQAFPVVKREDTPFVKFTTIFAQSCNVQSFTELSFFSQKLGWF